jgi:fucose 4-O-acetylase-like acetyltransferase
MLTIFAKKKIGLFLSIVLSLIAGYISEINETLTLARTIFFFPFYLLGHFLEKKHFEWIKAKMNVWISWIVFILLFVAVYLYGNID